MRQWCVLRYFGVEKLEKRKHYWALDNGSEITEKKILVSTGTPVGVTIMCRDKTTNSLISVCQFACPR